jgi:hypothetical protein
MNKTILYYLVGLMLLASAFAATCGGTMLGEGSVSNPCNITNCTELQDMRLNLTANYQLVNDIDCSDTINWNGGNGFISIGNTSGNSLNINFNGNYYNIYNLFSKWQTSSTSYNPGIFGYLSNADIINLKLTNITIYGGKGGIMYSNTNSNISLKNININSSLIYSVHQGASLISTGSTNGNINITNVSVRMDLNGSGFSSCAGLLVSATNAIIINSSFEGNINCSQTAGGLVYSIPNLDIINSYSKVNITSTGLSNGCGGIIGIIDSSKNVNIVNTYSYIKCDGKLTSAGGIISGLLHSAYSNITLNNTYSYFYYMNSTQSTSSYSDEFGFGCLIGRLVDAGGAENNFSLKIYNSFAVADLSNITSVTNGSIIGNVEKKQRFREFIIDNTFFNNVSSVDHCYINETDLFYDECTAIQNDESYFTGTDVASSEPMASWDFDNVWIATDGYPELRAFSATESCTESLVNTSWSDWADISCSGDQMNQSRSLTEYDENECGTYENVTYSEYQLIADTSCRADNTLLPAFVEMSNLFGLLVVAIVMGFVIILVAGMFGYRVMNIDLSSAVLLIVLAAMMLAIGIVVLSQLGI